jgi:hypothetical protein
MKGKECERELREDNPKLLHAWRQWHADELAEALAGPHGTVLNGISALLANLHSADQFIAFVAAQDWRNIDGTLRAIALYEIDQAIMALRVRRGLPPFDDPLPGAPDNAFLTIRSIIQFPTEKAGKLAEANR